MRGISIFVSGDVCGCGCGCDCSSVRVNWWILGLIPMDLS